MPLRNSNAEKAPTIEAEIGLWDIMTFWRASRQRRRRFFVKTRSIF